MIQDKVYLEIKGGGEVSRPQDFESAYTLPLLQIIVLLFLAGES